MARRVKTGDPRTAVAYLRVSTERQELGPEAQRAAVAAWAAREGARVAAWHLDAGVSGAAAIDRRPGLLAALADLAPQRAGVLVVAKRDRLARDVMAAAMVEQLAARAGARVLSAAGEGTGDDDPASLLLRRMVDSFAEYERALIRARTVAALRAKRARGERACAIPYGWRLAPDGRTLARDDDEQTTLLLVRFHRERGASLRAIVAALEAQGRRARGGGRFGLTQVARMTRAAP
jgi:site-specific DNA recombinase